MLVRWSTLVSRTLTTTRAFEEITILVALVTCVAASLVLHPNAQGAIGGGLAVLMIAIAVVDARRFIIPDELTFAALVLGFMHAAIQANDLVMQALASAALRGAVLAFAFWSLRVLYRHMRGREGIGLGDVKLAAVAGVWLDWSMTPVAIEIAALAALIGYAMRALSKGRPVRSTSRLPFGLFFAPAIWIGWLLQSTSILFPAVSYLQ